MQKLRRLITPPTETCIFLSIEKENCMNATIRQELSLQKNQFELSKDIRIVICGCGALGSHVIEALARAGFCTREGSMILVDNAEYSIENMSTSVLFAHQLYQSKVNICEQNVALLGNGTNITPVKTYLNSVNVKKIGRIGDIVIDCFDDTNNLEGRKVLIERWRNLDKSVPILHVGMNAEEIGCVLWNEKYILPENTDVTEEICDHAMSLSMILIVTSLALKSIYHYLSEKQYLNYLIYQSETISKV